jgi:hypothetical protein
VALALALRIARQHAARARSGARARAAGRSGGARRATGAGPRAVSLRLAEASRASAIESLGDCRAGLRTAGLPAERFASAVEETAHLTIANLADHWSRHPSRSPPLATTSAWWSTCVRGPPAMHSGMRRSSRAPAARSSFARASERRRAQASDARCGRLAAAAARPMASAAYAPKGKAGSRARKRNSDDYNGLGLLLVTRHGSRSRCPFTNRRHTSDPAGAETNCRWRISTRESRARGLPGTVSAAAARSWLVRRAVGHLGLRLRHSVQREQQLGALPVLPRRHRLAAEVLGGDEAQHVAGGSA